MGKITTTRFDAKKYLHTTEDMAAYLDASIEEANGDASFVAKAQGDIAAGLGIDLETVMADTRDVLEKPIRNKVTTGDRNLP